MAKYVSINEALSCVKTGDYIVTGLGAAEGREFMTNLHTIAGNVSNVMVSNCLPMGAGVTWRTVLRCLPCDRRK